MMCKDSTYSMCKDCINSYRTNEFDSRNRNDAWYADAGFCLIYFYDLLSNDDNDGTHVATNIYFHSTKCNCGNYVVPRVP